MESEAVPGAQKWNLEQEGCFFAGRRRVCPFKGQNETYEVEYKRFRRWIIQSSSRGGPVASTPVAPGRQCHPKFELDSICQRLELESPPRLQEHEHKILQANVQDGSPVKQCRQAVASLNTAQQSSIVSRRPDTENAPKQSVKWVWRAAVQGHGNTQVTDFHRKRFDLQPFAVLENTSRNVQSLLTLGAPSMLNDYYTNLLDCSCNGMVALALGSSVYLWNSETHSLVGHLEPSPDPGRRHFENQAISCLCWSRDGRALCIGNRLGEIQLWDVDHKQNMRYLRSQDSVVAALSWKQHLLSSGSSLGHIHHFDPRAPASVVGAVIQKEGVCSLQWSPGDDFLASGSTEGLLHIWDGDITGIKRSHQPCITMEQPSAVKALGWCPWQREVIATGGGWKDGELRIWDTKSGSCLASVNTNSQICSLRWAEKKRYLITAHGIPHHQITSWTWEFPFLNQINQLKGHCQRVLHLAINPDNTHIFSAGADQRFHIWTLGLQWLSRKPDHPTLLPS
ncbi:cell division cycle 20.3, cofactor of APC complex-like [Melanotaenia boesemani]|uniref:cell division cycle 20.3, cofactor of APC complex-like n=1 Tax=Melanotaenia boesemani TaxID=1250792 RepID=UPI001C05E836|nr:cell division cycle 20.3, cofactor of APC complex-like [Melanotaenia boesemani]